ncbi:TIM barrel protein [Halobacteriovorax sp. GFR7]|uniref:TIM barrel protein n=1 Tax=Bacteriovoracales TaxID=2024979 RepID=UPI0003864BA9|nr:TIM barrel protein [Bacteriovorax sp. BAL6_X]EPZ50429.1 xylose isomerase-like TIM barrel domain protein [Bacteriovorax sp. BAL6_X]
MHTKLLFGTAGVPNSTVKKNNPVEGVKRIHELGLDCMQLEFAHGVRMKEEVSSNLRKVSYELGVPLTSHGPYYINLNAREQDKIDSSVERIIQTAKISDLCGAESMTFHAAFYMKDSPYDVFDLVEKSMNVIEERLSRLDIEIELRPELTGKTSQFGSLEELISLTKNVDSCRPCMDFSHLYARTNQYNSEEEFDEVIAKLKEELGEDSVKNMHIHISGISTNSKGDLKHLNLEKSDFNWKDLLKSLKKNGCGGYMICNSPNLEDDALMLKNYYNTL